MKHSFIVFIILTISVFVFNSCKKRPEFSVIPQISFKSIQKYSYSYTVFGNSTSFHTDSIPITISFTDGDGDLGLSASDTLNPIYSKFDTTKDNTGNVIKYGSQPGMPAFYPYTYGCTPYTFDSTLVDTTYIRDTILVSYNPHYYNYHIVFLKKVGTSYDTITSCMSTNFCGQFPILSPANYSGPLQGDLKITISGDFEDQGGVPGAPELYLKGQTVKFRIYIEDRALHQSNIVETTDITF